MRRVVLQGMNGEEIVQLFAETPEDAEELRRMELDGEVDRTDYFHGEKPPERRVQASKRCPRKGRAA